MDIIKRLLGTNKYINGENVLGFIEGSDLKKELIIITAHYDHLGKHDSLIFNGQMMMLVEQFGYGNSRAL